MSCRNVFVLSGILLHLSHLVVNAQVPANKPSTYPSWWFRRYVLPQASQPPLEHPIWPTDFYEVDDYAAINQGQLKFLAVAASEELRENLPGVEVSPLAGLILEWNNPAYVGDNYATVNTGQLKAIAQGLYDRLIEVGYATEYPWSSYTGDTDDYMMVNIGQVKNLFSFDVTFSSDGNPIPDWWRLKHFTTLDVDPSASGTDDGFSNYYEYFFGLNPVLDDSLLDLDGDGIPNEMDARPDDSSVGQMVFTITFPSDGSTM